MTSAASVRLTTTDAGDTQPTNLLGATATFSLAQGGVTLIREKKAGINDSVTGTVVLPISGHESGKFSKGDVIIDIQVEFPSGERRIWGPLALDVREPIT